MKPTIAMRFATPPANIATSSGTIHAPSSPSATSGSVASACTTRPPASARRAPTRAITRGPSIPPSTVPAPSTANAAPVASAE